MSEQEEKVMNESETEETGAKVDMECDEVADDAQTGETNESLDDDCESIETEEEPSDDNTEDTESSADSDEAEKKRGFGRRKEKKDKRDEQIEELTDRVKRQMAEFDNFRKRSEKEKSQMYELGAKSVIEKILPVMDNFERGIAAIPEESKEDPIATGMEMIYRQLSTELENLGVKPIEALGSEFDPNFHNAVMQVESEEYESGVVAQELQKGYMYRDSVVRHSMVAVVQ